MAPGAPALLRLLLSKAFVQKQSTLQALWRFLSAGEGNVVRFEVGASRIPRFESGAVADKAVEGIFAGVVDPRIKTKEK